MRNSTPKVNSVKKYENTRRNSSKRWLIVGFQLTLNF